MKASWEGVGVSEGCPFCVASAGPPATQSLAPKGLIQSFVYSLIHPFPGFFWTYLIKGTALSSESQVTTITS